MSVNPTPQALSEAQMAEAVKIEQDATMFGTGVSVDGKYVPLTEFYVQPEDSLAGAIEYAIGMLDELSMFGGTPSDYAKIKQKLSLALMKYAATSAQDNQQGAK